MIYLDNAATQKPCEEAINAFLNSCENSFGNPSSLHELGIVAENVLNDCKKNLAESVFAPPECIYLTSGATESNNIAIFGVAKNYSKRKNKIVTTSKEHASVKNPILQLEKNGIVVEFAEKSREKAIEPDDIISLVDENTFLVSLILTDNNTGENLPITQIFSQIKRKFPDVITHCDAVQAFMKIPIDVRKLNADIITFSGHKIGAFKGIGALYIKKGVRVAPLFLGGGQEKNLRSGTESVQLAAAFSNTIKARKGNFEQNYENALVIKNYILEKAREIEAVTAFEYENSSPYITALSIANIKSEIMLHFLESKGIYVSSGSACSKGKNSDSKMDFVIRVSIGYDTKKSEIDELFMAIQEGLRTLVKKY